jgi:CheY-like chemotaxis protein
MMGGTVAVASTPGVGTTFTVRLPVAPRGPAVEQLALVEEAEPSEAGTVLVIDDDPAVRDLMRRALAKDGYRVVEADGGEAGLRAARDQRPDVITLDVLMPGMDGWAVLAALKRDPALEAIPVVMLTILDEPQLGFTLGAAEYLTKPVDRERLLSTLQRLVPAGGERPVLVVEDDAATREMLSRTLGREGWTVIEAENGRVGLDRLADHRPGLVLLDLMMPEMDGFTFLEALRAQEAPLPPVVVLTAKHLTAADRARLNGGVTHVIEKGGRDRDALFGEVKALVAAHARAGRVA